MNAGRMVSSLIGSFGGRALGGMIGGSTGRMIGSLLGSMVGAGGLRRASSGLGGLLGGLGGGGGSDSARPVEMPEEEAVLLLRAMTNAAKADGQVDAQEMENIIERAGDLEPDEQAWLRMELGEPLDVDAFIASVPSGMEAEVYTASLLPIDVDTVAERSYLRTLADGLGLREEQVNEIHEALEIPTL